MMPMMLRAMALVAVLQACHHDVQPNLGLKAERLALNVKGTGKKVERIIKDVTVDKERSLPSDCFEVGLFLAERDKRIGTAVNCIFVADKAPSGSGMRVIITTMFDIDDRGRFAIQSKGTAQPVNWPQIGFEGASFTHITGANSPINSIIQDGFADLASTGDFEGAKGSSRLSGMIDMSTLQEGYMTFDCLFVVDMRERQKNDDEDESHL